MTAGEVLTVCRQAGIRLEAIGDKIRYEAPPGTLTPTLRDTLTQHKTELLGLLAQQFVTLKNGPTLPLPVLQLAWTLEGRGFELSLTSTGDLQVTPIAALIESDRAAITRWRQHLQALTEYVDEVVV